MPNWTQNTLVLKGPVDDLKAIHAAITTDGHIDFERLAPMPPILRRVISPIRKGEHGRTMLMRATTDPRDFEAVEATEEEEAEIQKLGGVSWYEWAVNNWGTKWNACNQDAADYVEGSRFLEYVFDTAWCHPVGYYNILGAWISANYPEVEGSWRASHEDGGYDFDTLV